MMLLLVLAVTCVGVANSASGIAGDTYSCFTNFQSISTEGCKSRVEQDDGSVIQTSLDEVENMDFCVSGPAYGQTKQGSFGKAKNYVASADMKMTDLGKYSKSYGFMGITFNMMDSKNYDIAYVRPHAKTQCWELGYVENGLLFGRDFGSCSRPVKSEFNLAVHIENGKGALYVNGAKEADFTPFFPPSNKVATAMRNNMKAQMETKNMEICQEINCVSRSENGKTMITPPFDSYRDEGMNECQACKCQLYGKIQCGCKSAEEQGVSCTGSMISAVGHDCCARCVPPSATCYASGDPHYKSWDGRGFDFQGKCTYCLAKTNDFEVRHKNFGGGSVSYNEYCQLLFDGDMFEMRTHLYYTAAGGTPQQMVTPYKKYYSADDYVSCLNGAQCDLYIKHKKVLGINCAYRRAVTLWLHGTYYERTSCMCGTWDGDTNNDFKDREGNAVGSPNEMAQAFRVSNNDGCPNPPEPTDPCEALDREQKNWAEQFCARYKQEPFKSCPLDVTQSFKNCKFDACMEPDNDDNICQNAETYADDCAAAGHPVVGWRSNSFCPLDCPDSFVYNSCGNGCHKTCADPDPDDCKDICVEGCYCPPGTVLQDNQCIDAEDCQCLVEGSFVENGVKWNDTARCETCQCNDGGIIDCGDLACSSCPAGEVPVSKVGKCCPVCLADWTDETEEKIELTEEEGPATLQCKLHEDVLVSPDDVTWKKVGGEIVDPESLPDNFKLSEDRLTLTINPAYLTDDNEYVAEVVFNGVVGECRFELEVLPIPPKNIIDIDGDSPRVVKQGDCQTMSVKVVSDDVFQAEDFVWTSGPIDKPIDFGDGSKFTLKNGGKTIEVCDADDDEEGMYQACVTKDDVTDCVEIELEVIAVCTVDGKEVEEDEEWDEGEHKTCKCSTEGEIECSCKEQEVECKEGEQTYFEEDCEKLCARDPANCLITGDPHYKSFDGHRHDFQGGNCRFTAIKTEDFEVIGTNVHRGDNKNVAWNDAVQVRFNNVDVYLGAEGEVKVNGKAVTLPFTKTWLASSETVSVTKAGESVVLKLQLPNGLEALDLVWDGNSTVSSTIHGKYYEGTTGLCGSWDENPDNDQAGKDGAPRELNDFGWDWKVTEGDEVCKEEPQPPHPCDDTFFPEATPIADGACDILNDAPFDACHELVDVKSAIYNCKYDTCSCFDESCACHAVKTYVKECKEKGVTTLDSWREKATYCPLTCSEGLSYYPCGSFCPPTCADKTPDCGPLTGQCNEGCFCPKDTYLLGDKCVKAADCKCEFEGKLLEIGATWADKNICKDCACVAEGNVVCEKMKCEKKCAESELPVYEGDDCCPTCVEKWLWTDQDKYEDVEEGTDLTVSCQSVVDNAEVSWAFSGDDGKTWEDIAGATSLEYTISGITSDNAGQYKCKARHSFKSKTATIIVETAAPAAKSCTATAPEFGSVDPEEVTIGGIVSYSCNEGYELKGSANGQCQEDGTISNTDVSCEEKEAGPLDFGTYEVPLKKKVNIACSIADKSFDANAVVEFWWIKDGKRVAKNGQIKNKQKYSNKKGKSTYSAAKVSTKKKPLEIECFGTSADGTKTAKGTIILKKKEKKKKKKTKGL